MQNRILMLATAFTLAYAATPAGAQQGPMVQQQAQTPQPQQQPLAQGNQGPRGGAEEDDAAISGWHHSPGWGRYGGHMGFGMMRDGAIMGRPGGGVMMRMLFAMMDSDGDGTVSLQEFQAAHERIFKAMDANKDGVLTPEEIQSFLRGTGTSVQGTGTPVPARRPKD